DITEVEKLKEKEDMENKMEENIQTDIIKVHIKNEKTLKKTNSYIIEITQLDEENITSPAKMKFIKYLSKIHPIIMKNVWTEYKLIDLHEKAKTRKKHSIFSMRETSWENSSEIRKKIAEQSNHVLKDLSEAG